MAIALLGLGLWWMFPGNAGSRPLQPHGKPPPAPTLVNRIDLHGWKLTIPEEGNNGSAAIIEPAATKQPWLAEGPDGSLTFWAPARGGTTRNSKHPRTELDSLNNFSAATTGPHTLKAALVVVQVPTDTQDIILGQIHGAGDISSVPYVMLHYQAGAIKVVVKQKLQGSQAQSAPLLTGVPLNRRFDFTISDLGDGTMVFTANYGTDTRQATIQVPTDFHDETVRFQVGDYQQADQARDAVDGGRVIFYQISELTTPP
ncbi:polysaccharide lyase family 7 protein [Nocardia sp. NPDC052278]|uniref:polysaccharide lyase family 7 protein n=1 Tax=unclassified Nocardia TaxID=2637762 RepID=UPI00367F4423